VEAKEEYECRLCNSTFDKHRYKITHNCPEKPETYCKKRGCGREPKDEYGYCSGHKPKIWSGLVGEKEIKEKEVPLWEVEIHYTEEHYAEVKAPNKQAAKEKVWEMSEEETMVDKFEVHDRVKQKGSVTETEDRGWKEEPPKFKKLDSMRVETVTGETSGDNSSTTGDSE
jgi:hypothetical protein